MNLNDNRYPIKIEDVFNSNGEFVKNKNGVEVGKELLIQKMIGYVSYVKGENLEHFQSYQPSIKHWKDQGQDCRMDCPDAIPEEPPS